MTDPLLRTTSSFSRPHICLKPLVNSNQRFSTKDFKLTQTLLDHYWNRLMKEYVPELNKRVKWQKSNEELDEGDVVWVLKDFTPRSIWLLGKIVTAHRGSNGIARSFDIQTATGMIQRPAVTLSPVFPQSSSAPEGHQNKFIEAHSLSLSHTQKTQCQNENFFALLCLHFHIKLLAFVVGSVKEPSSFIFYLPPHPHFPPPTHNFVLQNPFIS